MKPLNLAKTILILIIVVLISCEKENAIENGISNKTNPLLAGVFGTSGYYLKITTTIKIEEKESGCLIYKGMDSLDINDDDNFDIGFCSQTQSPDLSGICCNYSDDTNAIYDCWPTGRIYKYLSVIDSSFQIACVDRYPICLSYGDTIRISKAWENGQFLSLIDIYNFPPPESSYGKWTSKDDKFIGIRNINSDTLYGWIKINTGETIEVKEMYFDNKE